MNLDHFTPTTLLAMFTDIETEIERRESESDCTLALHETSTKIRNELASHGYDVQFVPARYKLVTSHKHNK